MKELGIGIVGCGDAGRAHALAFLNAMLTFGPQPAIPRLAAASDPSKEKRDRLTADFGVRRSSEDWCSLIEDPAIELVVIAVTDETALQIAQAAITHGKHILCEQTRMSSREARSVADAAERAGVAAGVSLPYVHNPVQTLAKKLISTGELGSITGFKAAFDADVALGGSGTRELRAMTSSIIGLALYLLGPIHTLSAMAKSFRGACGDDLVQFLCEFKCGAVAHVSANRRGTGRKLGLTYEVQGQAGAICFTQERMNELDLFRQGEPLETRGYKTIYSGPDQPNYAAFHPLPGVGLSFSDQRTFEAHEFIVAISQRRQPEPNFHFAANVCRVEEAVTQSIKSRGWVRVNRTS
jgi:predicted dehydrogenase